MQGGVENIKDKIREKAKSFTIPDMTGKKAKMLFPRSNIAFGALCYFKMLLKSFENVKTRTKYGLNIRRKM